MTRLRRALDRNSAAWRWAWWLARRRPPPSPPPGPPESPHPPYYGDRAQLPHRDYDTKERR